MRKVAERHVMHGVVEKNVIGFVRERLLSRVCCEFGVLWVTFLYYNYD